MKINTNENGCSLHTCCVFVYMVCVVETKSILVCQNTEDCAKICRTFTKSYTTTTKKYYKGEMMIIQFFSRKKHKYMLSPKIGVLMLDFRKI